jgi:transcriptional regulator with XRE-family HTH domain
MSKRANAVVAEEIAEKSFYLEGVRRGEVAAKLRHQMRQNGLLVKDIAERLGVSVANVSRSLSGTQNLTIDQLYRLADAVEASLVLGVAKPDEYKEMKFVEDGEAAPAGAGAVLHLDQYRTLRSLREAKVEGAACGVLEAVESAKLVACA